MELGILQACIVNPETCGVAGGAIAFWLKITYLAPDGIRAYIQSANYSSGVSIRSNKNAKKLV